MGKLVIKLIRGGGRLVSDAIQAAREVREQRAQAKSSTYTSRSNTPDIPTHHTGHYVLADEEIARGLIQEGRAELPASNELSSHQPCAELPAANEISLHRDYAELPSVSNEYHPQQSRDLGPPYPVDEKANHIAIEPIVSHGYPDSNEIHHERLPTYEESEWAPVAFSRTEGTADYQRPSIDRVPIAQTVHPISDFRGVQRPVVIPQCACSHTARV
ncbi:uncharacterized protein KD926_008394 [Aspergillus affinis]|uniref:uncharacterized protein n=1 Tax=Aspergillus affinis TaxID=1070780 RepID=UPI0022FEE714|nr:uncharacterized protein KD926_008394 [Aspergillus affinis]KAI9040304.1 hypothetical protein KD926_008394 [Aspergillus affinis]